MTNWLNEIYWENERDFSPFRNRNEIEIKKRMKKKYEKLQKLFKKNNTWIISEWTCNLMLLLWTEGHGICWLFTFLNLTYFFLI